MTVQTFAPVQRYPLQWPAGWKRTQSLARRSAAFNQKWTAPGAPFPQSKRLSIGDAMARVFFELERLGVKHVQEDVVVSTNLRSNISGIPRGDQGEPSDPGVAVYWERKGERQCMAIDQYNRVADNIAAVAATLEAMRAIERHGGAEILNRAFTGFAALPAPVPNWRAALGFHNGQLVTLDQAESKFRDLAKTLHSDQGGNDDSMRLLIEARDAARLELGGK